MKYNLSIISMFKNESSIINQWIKHYLDEGVDHFYLIDNGSTDNYEDEIKDYMKYITLIIDPYRQEINTQNILINKYFFEKVKKESEWVIICDIDEYIFNTDIDNNIFDYLKNLNNISKLIIPWKCFAGHKDKNIIPHDICISLFARTNNIQYGTSNVKYGYSKSIVKTNDLINLEVHNSTINDEKKTKLLNIDDKLHLNHYQLISELYYKKIKCNRGGGQTSFTFKYTMDFYKKEHFRCLVIEDNLLKNKKILNSTSIINNNNNNNNINNNNNNNNNNINISINIVKSYLIIYSYFENMNSLKNLKFFIKHGIKKENNVKYLFIINGDKCSINIPKYENIYILKRPNVGHDFAAWSYGLYNHNYINYDRYIFLNDTVIGPFLPLYIDSNNKWYEMFCKPINSLNKLSGLSINSFPFNYKKSSHVQSMMFCTDLIGLKILINSKILCDNISNYIEEIKIKNNYIIKYEIGMSQQIIKNGYNITSLNYTSLKNKEVDDIWFNNSYFNTTINPLETMFIKSNRINNKLIDFYIESLS
jgi:hypothetical protein